MTKSTPARRLHLHLCGYGFEDANLRGSKLHFHPFWQMNLVCGGFAFYFTANGKRKIQPGDIVLAPPGVSHCLETVPGCDFCDYSFKFFPGEEFSADHTIFTEPEQREQQLLWINALGEIFKSIAPPELILRPVEFPLSSDTPGIELLEELLYGFCRRLCAEGDTAGSWVIKKIRLAVQDRKGSAISVEECAEKLNCSTGHLRTLVKQETGSTTKEIIDRERIKIIRQLLVYSNISISEMAKKTGFSDVIYFERFFKKYCGETPRTFRKRSKENIL